MLLEDQLSHCVSSLAGCDKQRDIVLMCEVMQEFTYVKHHQKKIAFLLSAMRHFANELRDQGYKVSYTQLDDDDNTGSIRGEVKRALRQHAIDTIVVTHPGQYRLLQEIRSWQDQFGIPVHVVTDNRFLCEPEEFAAWA